MKSAAIERRLTQGQVQALVMLVRQPELFEALESILADLHRAASEDFDAAKSTLVFAEGARVTALIAHGRVLALTELLDLFNRQKV